MPQFRNLKRRQHTRHAVEIPAVWYRVQVGARHEYFRIIMAPVSPEYIAGTIGADTHADIFHPAGDFLLRLLFRHGVAHAFGAFIFGPANLGYFKDPAVQSFR